MISKVFVDRPRLAIVIAVVTVIAGAISLLQIPVAQFPDIVPPQVEVTARFPGASAEVVEATVGQLLESKVVGVDNMIYMKSTSGNDGSYTLLVSFALGTDPDQNTVNVNNRVQLAVARLPQEVQQQGLSVKKKSSAMLQVISLRSTSGAQDPLFISNYATINILDEVEADPRGRRRAHARAARLLHADLVRDRPADRARPHAWGHRRRDPAAEPGGAGRPDRRAADQHRRLLPAQHPHPGPARRRGGVRQHRRPRQPGRLGAARPRRGEAGARGGHPRRRDPDQRAPGDPDRHLSRAGCQCGRRRRGDQASRWSGCASASPRASSTRWSTTPRSSSS